MVNPLRIARENDIDSASVSAGASISTLPASNVKTKDIQQIWRSGAGSTFLLADIGSALTTEYMLLVNCIADSSVRFRKSSVDNTGAAGDIYNSGLIASNWNAVERMVLHFIETGDQGRYLRIDGVTEAGRMATGQVFAPSRDMSLGVEYLWRDFSRRTQMPAGHEFIERRNRQKGYRFTLRGLTAAEAETEVYTLNRINGASQDILVCRDKDAADIGAVSIWGLLEQPAVVRESNTPGFFEVEFAVWQRL